MIVLGRLNTNRREIYSRQIDLVPSQLEFQQGFPGNPQTD